MNQNDEDKRIAWEWAFHEDKIFGVYARTFLTANTFLAAACGVIFEKDSASSILFFISILGLILTFMWFIVQWQSALVISEIENELQKEGNNSLFLRVFNPLEQSSLFHFSRNTLLAFFLPFTFFLWWIAFPAFLIIKHHQ